ncbi:MAG: formylglycine-generating enzyme family protein [Verrucomicrobia bacterium]|nr:formylglycine-generating enzyme family protein [Verrucomicrobiota bacterium]
MNRDHLPIPGLRQTLTRSRIAPARPPVLHTPSRRVRTRPPGPPPPRLLALALASLLLSGCGPAPSTTPSPHPAPVTPRDVVTASGIAMVSLPGGTFTMGSTRGHPDESPPHTVRVSAFLIDKCEVTHTQFTRVQLPNPSRWQDHRDRPVERVRWLDAKQYCNERSRLEGLKPCYDETTRDWDCDYTAPGYRLPTEAEWEYAARAGTGGDFEFGAASQLRFHAWFKDTSDQKTHPVGRKRPNRWGIHDLLGNVSEWCEDVYDPAYYTRSPASNPTGPQNPGNDVRRVIRGGSWRSGADACRASARQGEKTGDSDACFATDHCGFRCVRRATPEEINALSGPGRLTP